VTLLFAKIMNNKKPTPSYLKTINYFTDSNVKMNRKSDPGYSAKLWK
jgi:hypothetical protein